MDLYYGLTNYHLLCCILHKIKYNRKRKAIFVTSQGILKNRLKDLEDSQIFERVVYLEDTEIREKCFADLSDTMTNEDIENVTLNFIETYKNILPFNIKKISNFFISADHGVFGIYVILKKYKYTFFEDGRGIYSNWKLLDNLLSIKNPQLRIMCNYIGAYGRNSLVTNKYVAFDSQTDGFDEIGCINFDVNTILDDLPKEILNKIFRVFTLKPIELEKDKKIALILTQRFSTYNMLTEEECLYLYALLSDIFAENFQIFLKPHPADKTKYNVLFSANYIINREIPSELIRFVLGPKIALGLCTYSSSINSLKPYIEDIYYIDDSIVYYKSDIINLYVLFELSKKFGIKINGSTTNMLFLLFAKKYNLSEEKMVLNMDNLVSDENSVKKSFFANANLVLKINIVVGEKNILQELYFNIKNLKIRKEILKYKYDKILPLSNIMISAYTENIIMGESSYEKFV